MQITSIEGIYFANIHLQPLHLFGYSYATGAGKDFADATEKVISAQLTHPLIFVGDFNNKTLLKDFAGLIHRHKLSSALGAVSTTDYGSRDDYMLYTPEIHVESSIVIRTKRADHFVCVMEISLL